MNTANREFDFFSPININNQRACLDEATTKKTPHFHSISPQYDNLIDCICALSASVLDPDFNKINLENFLEEELSPSMEANISLLPSDMREGIGKIIDKIKSTIDTDDHFFKNKKMICSMTNQLLDQSLSFTRTN